ncbi:MAG TPA: PQQ-binding-like beta-propeller repeat protein [Kofleriaceae bacterium]|nr:PQQ-binding-like beta-propeller repeat protein [Kofleriaceae bacterium]
MLIHGFVFDDANGDGRPQAGEHGVANAVVALGVDKFVVTDANGNFELEASEDRTGGAAIFWVRVPDGFRPGPVWAPWDGTADHPIELALHRLAQPVRGPLTFVVTADTHLPADQANSGAADLAAIAREATALDPAPAFFTILGDITQGGTDPELALVDRALAGLDVPYIPVPGNHDWYDGGDAWFRHYGPDNYSFDLAGVHFVVWNMAMTEDDIRAYLGAELARVAKGMPIVALTHAPPSPGVVDVLRELGVSYVLTGHAHSNRATDHDGVIELNTEPLLMGGLDFTPAGYRVITITAGQLASYHRTTVDAPQLHASVPECMPARDGELLVAAELDAGQSSVVARVDCATPIGLTYAGGWTWRAQLPPLPPGRHDVAVEATSPSGEHATTAASFDVCDPGPAPARGEDWPQIGGGPAHLGARARELVPPLITRWVAAAGGHVVTAPPAIANGIVYVATTDLGDGGAGGIVAIDLATGAVRWRATTPVAVRGGVAVIDTAQRSALVRAQGLASPALVVATQIDGIVLGLDAATGAIRWRHALAPDAQPTARALFASPTADGGDVVVGHEREVAALAGATGTPLWSADPVPDATDSQSLAAIAIAGGVAVGTFNRQLGGVIAWDRASGRELWRHEGPDVLAINASPLVANDSAYVVAGTDDVLALDLATGDTRWQTRLDDAGFAWGNATVGTPVLARGVLVVPTLYGALVALDAESGAELWRSAAAPGPLRTTHYRGAGEAGFAASPVATGGIVWAADTAGELVARDLRTGDELWRTSLDVPVLAGLAASGDALVVASYDGTVRAFAPGHARVFDTPASCTEPAPAAGCCDSGDASSSVGSLLATGFVAAALLRRRRS